MKWTQREIHQNDENVDRGDGGNHLENCTFIVYSMFKEGCPWRSQNKTKVRLITTIATNFNLPICINNFLIGIGETIGSKICRRGFHSIHHMKYYAHLWVAIKSSTLERLLNLLNYKRFPLLRLLKSQKPMTKNYDNSEVAINHISIPSQNNITWVLANIGHHPSPTRHFLVTSKLSIFNVSYTAFSLLTWIL